MWGFLGGAVAGLGLSLFGANQERKAYKAQAAAIREQRALNREISEFNKSVLERTYPEIRAGIKMELRNVVAKQMASLAVNGFAPGSASPYFILGETTRMGEKSLQEAAFNHQVDLKNEEFRAKSIDNSLGMQLNSAKYNARAAGFKMFTRALSAGIKGYSLWSGENNLNKKGSSSNDLTFSAGFGIGLGVD